MALEFSFVSYWFAYFCLACYEGILRPLSTIGYLTVLRGKDGKAWYLAVGWNKTENKVSDALLMNWVIETNVNMFQGRMNFKRKGVISLPMSGTQSSHF